MLISRNWLQRHIEQKLPKAEAIAESLLLHSFEIEGIEEKNGDSVIDIDVLPNRAHDCLGHQGIAREYAAVTGNNFIPMTYQYPDGVTFDTENSFPVTILNEKACFRYSARLVQNINITDSPEWLAESLNTLGQKSINSVVDATNFVLFDLGQPTHVFDADKIVGGITVRNAEEGEKVFLLGSDEEYILSSADLVIADDEGVLALAGIKGGTKAEVTRETKNILLEVANFDSVTVRKTARRLKLFTDASKRYENGISSLYVEKGMEALSMLVSGIHELKTLGAITDIYPNKEIEREIECSLSDIQNLLGLKITEKKVLDIFDRLAFIYSIDKNSFRVKIPLERKDLIIKEDLIEEVGRLYGYHNIPVQSLEGYSFEPELHQLSFVENELKNLLIHAGYTELKSYSFVNKGEVELYNPLASDKKALRKNLLTLNEEALEKNLHYLDFFGVDVLRTFEIGRVYTKEGEYTECLIAVKNKDKQANKKYGTETIQLETLITQIEEKFKVSLSVRIEKGNFLIFRLDDIQTSLDNYDSVFDEKSYSESSYYHHVSAYPFSVRDVSFWSLNTEIGADEYQKIIKGTDARYLKKIFLFDQFEKEGRVSYAFSLVFQSDEKTLSDDDINNDMNLIIQKLEQLGAEIR